MLVAAAAVMAVLAVAHSIIGEVRLIPALLARDDLPRLFGGIQYARGTIRFAWHVTSVLGLVLAAVVLEIAIGAGRDVLIGTIGAGLIVSGILPLAYTRGRHLAWLVFFAAGALCLWDALG